MNFSRVVFCDFDGTITTKDNFVRTCPPSEFTRGCGSNRFRVLESPVGWYRSVSVLEKFVPEAAAQFLPAIFRREITLKGSIEKTLGSISTKDYPALIEFIADQPIRPGLEEFIEFLNNVTIPLVVISGGLTVMVKAVLKRQKLLSSVTGIYAGEVNTTGDFLPLYSLI